LDSKAGGSNYWDSAGDFWTQILVNGKDAYQESKKLAAIWKANVSSAAGLV